MQKAEATRIEAHLEEVTALKSELEKSRENADAYVTLLAEEEAKATEKNTIYSELELDLLKTRQKVKDQEKEIETLNQAKMGNDAVLQSQNRELRAAFKRMEETHKQKEISMNNIIESYKEKQSTGTDPRVEEIENKLKESREDYRKLTENYAALRNEHLNLKRARAPKNPTTSGGSQEEFNSDVQDRMTMIENNMKEGFSKIFQLLQPQKTGHRTGDSGVPAAAPIQQLAEDGSSYLAAAQRANDGAGNSPDPKRHRRTTNINFDKYTPAEVMEAQIQRSRVFKRGAKPIYFQKEGIGMPINVMKQLLSKAGVTTAPMGQLWNIDFIGNSTMELLIDPEREEEVYEKVKEGLKLEPNRSADVWKLSNPREGVHTTEEANRRNNALFAKKRAARALERDERLRKENRRPLPPLVTRFFRQLKAKADEIISEIDASGSSGTPTSTPKPGITNTGEDEREAGEPQSSNDADKSPGNARANPVGLSQIILDQSDAVAVSPVRR